MTRLNRLTFALAFASLPALLLASPAGSSPTLPRHPSLLWFVPDGVSQARSGTPAITIDPAGAALVRGIRAYDQGDFRAAIAQLPRGSGDSAAVGEYALYYLGWAQLRDGRLDDADRTFRALELRKPAGYLSQALPQRLAELAEAQRDFDRAIRQLEPLTRERTGSPQVVLMHLGRAADAAGNRERAISAYRRVYYEFPLSDEAATAGAELARLDVPRLPETALARFALDLGRGERLFGARRYAQARDAFQALQPLASGDDGELVALRLAECDYYLRRFASARDGVQPFLERASRKAEARFFYLTARRSLGDTDTYLALVRQLVDEFPQSSWSEDALNNLATHYIVEDDDAAADRVFRELYERFPQGRYAERAAWKVGWWAYRNGNRPEAVRVFESAVAAFPHSDYRPSWIYWSGRAHEQLGDLETAAERYRVVVADYQNSYYGRLATGRLEAKHLPVDAPVVTLARDPVEGGGGAAATAPPTDQRIRVLLGLELYDQAEQELTYAQRMWGDSPAIQATLGWIYSRRGDLRRGINAMKRAYPQYMAAGGEDLPPDLLRVLFPLDYWPLIRKYAAAHDLDPFVVAALINQESTFTPDIRSGANAVGLMQILPSTGRRYARQVGIRRFNVATLTQPEANVRIGTAYFSDLVKRFGGTYFALASYNAGENRITRWIAERPGITQDEFIDDIPFPETQGYVKKILGSAADYRRLYGDGSVTAASRAARSGRMLAGKSSAVAPKAAKPKKGHAKGKAHAPKKRKNSR